MQNRNLLLHHLLSLVPFDGWSQYAFTQAAKRAGLNDAAAKQAFPRGVDECIDYFFSEQDRELAETFPEGSLSHLRIPERIEALLIRKFQHLLPTREAVRRAVARNAMPWNVGKASASLYRSVDLMWQLAGDVSTDFSYYTKRMTLAGIYSATLLFWLNDNSEQQSDTQAFLKRRLQDVANFGRWKKDRSRNLQKILS